MSSRKQILIAHYSGVLRKAASWAAMLAMMGTTLVAMPASAVGTQMGARNVTPTSLKSGSAFVSYAITFKVSATLAVGGMMIEVCDSPIETVSCAASASANVNSNGADASAATFTTLTGTACTGGTWAAAAAPVPGPGVNGTARRFTNSGTVVTPTSANACTLTVGNIKNPAGNNQKFYLRLTTYNTNTYTGEQDFGGFALQTAQDIVVSATVQETLEFCTGDNTLVATCSTIGTGAISLGTGSNCPILTTANVCTGVSKMAASTNAQAGYSITYNGGTFTNTGATDTITETGSPGATSAPASKQFGLAITSHTGTGTIAAVYDFAGSPNKYAYVSGAPTVIATGTAASGEDIYTVTYAANVSSITKAGSYSTTINYVATGLF